MGSILEKMLEDVKSFGNSSMSLTLNTALCVLGPHFLPTANRVIDSTSGDTDNRPTGLILSFVGTVGGYAFLIDQGHLGYKHLAIPLATNVASGVYEWIRSAIYRAKFGK